MPYQILNLILIPKISITYTPTKEAFLYSNQEPSQKTTAGHNAKTKGLWGSDYTGSTAPASTAQERSWKKGGKTVSAKMPGSL